MKIESSAEKAYQTLHQHSQAELDAYKEQLGKEILQSLAKQKIEHIKRKHKQRLALKGIEVVDSIIIGADGKKIDI